jgi:hypothetical protein
LVVDPVVVGISIWGNQRTCGVAHGISPLPLDIRD